MILRRSGMKSFPFVREVWPEKAQKENIESDQAKGSMKLDEQIYILIGNEAPKLLMFWELDYKTRITNDESMTLPAKFNVHLLLVKYNALNAVKDALNLFVISSEVKDINDFCNPETRISIKKLRISDKEKKQYLKGNAHKDLRVRDIINACIYHL